MMNVHKSVHDCLCNEVRAVLLLTSCLQWDDVHNNEKMVSSLSSSITLEFDKNATVPPKNTHLLENVFISR